MPRESLSQGGTQAALTAASDKNGRYFPRGSHDEILVRVFSGKRVVLCELLQDKGGLTKIGAGVWALRQRPTSTQDLQELSFSLA
jgi:hypothetical protein